MEKYHWLTVVCEVMGWVYFIAWSVSFYPQKITNFKRKAVIGMSFDYIGIYNFTGYVGYTIYTLATFVHEGGLSNKNNPVRINDITFAVHALILTVFGCVQILIYDRGSQKPSVFAMILGSICWVLALYNTVLSVLGDPAVAVMQPTIPWFGTFSTISFFGYINVAISFIKYIPQMYMNFKDKSTTGWSIYVVLLDFMGGSLSLLQQILSGFNTNDWSFVSDNIPKLILGLEPVVFDMIFMFQHYVLYGDNDSPLRLSKAELLQKSYNEIPCDESQTINANHQ
eukprot:180098_1